MVKELEGNGSGLLEILSGHLFRSAQENNEKPVILLQ
jgi:hypothetical protein